MEKRRTTDLVVSCVKALNERDVVEATRIAGLIGASDSALVCAVLARVMVANGKRESATQLFERARKLSNKKSDNNFQYIRAYVEAFLFAICGKKREAVDCIEKAINLKPDAIIYFCLPLLPMNDWLSSDI